MRFIFFFKRFVPEYLCIFAKEHTFYNFQSQCILQLDWRSDTGHRIPTSHIQNPYIDQNHCYFVSCIWYSVRINCFGNVTNVCIRGPYQLLLIDMICCVDASIQFQSFSSHSKKIITILETLTNLSANANQQICRMKIFAHSSIRYLPFIAWKDFPHSCPGLFKYIFRFRVFRLNFEWSTPPFHSIRFSNTCCDT